MTQAQQMPHGSLLTHHMASAPRLRRLKSFFFLCVIAARSRVPGPCRVGGLLSLPNCDQSHLPTYRDWLPQRENALNRQVCGLTYLSRPLTRSEWATYLPTRIADPATADPLPGKGLEPSRRVGTEKKGSGDAEELLVAPSRRTRVGWLRATL